MLNPIVWCHSASVPDRFLPFLPQSGQGHLRENTHSIPVAGRYAFVMPCAFVVSFPGDIVFSVLLFPYTKKIPDVQKEHRDISDAASGELHGHSFRHSTS